MSDIIVGIHSIAEVIKNKERSGLRLMATNEGIQHLRERGGITGAHLERVTVSRTDPGKLQSDAQHLYKEHDFEFQRVPSGLLLMADPLPTIDVSWCYEMAKAPKRLRLLALDQVTDIHNGGAILRSCSFYGVDALIVSSKGHFGLSPSFYRIASGATEHVHVIQSTNLSRMLTKLQELGVLCIGFSEEKSSGPSDIPPAEKTCLVMGAEDTGLSNAVERALVHHVALRSQGAIRSLNVSVASAIAMEKFYSNEKR